MRCPFCESGEDKVIDSRVSKDGREIRRRRECEACSRRFTTYERIEESMPMVVKRDGRREPFDRNKIERGLAHAVAKRPVSLDQVKDLAEDVEREISELGVAEIESRAVGERVLPRLRGLDQVAYVRFASIYRDFRDLDQFANEVEQLRASEGSGRIVRASVEGAGEVGREVVADVPAPQPPGLP
jgi:transcriptional repressor NrdR